MGSISFLLHESEMEPRTSVNNKGMLWGLTGFYPSALIYYVFNNKLVIMHVNMFQVMCGMSTSK